MLPLKLYELPAPLSDLSRVSDIQLPIYVEPERDEALRSWALRLATRLGVSLNALARGSFGLDATAADSPWWSRPDPWLLARISARSGVPVDQLRRMTFCKWRPNYRDDEASDRFCGRRFETGPPAARRANRFAVCGECVTEDESPYVRISWLLGWTAFCPRHAVLLITRCPHCRVNLRFKAANSETPFTVRNCRRCGGELRNNMPVPVSSRVLQLQAMLLEGKRDGLVNFEGIGDLNWTEAVVLVDVLIGMFWTGTTFEERGRMRAQYEYASQDLAAEEASPYHSRYGALHFLSWLTRGWPESEDTIVFQVTSGRGLDPRRPLSLTIFPRRLATTYGNYSLPVDASNDPQQLVVQRIQFMIRRKSVQPRQYGNLGTNSVFGYPVRISRKNDKKRQKTDGRRSGRSEEGGGRDKRVWMR